MPKICTIRKYFFFLLIKTNAANDGRSTLGTALTMATMLWYAIQCGRMFECMHSENTKRSMPWLCCTAAETICSNNTIWTPTSIHERRHVLCQNNNTFVWRAMVCVRRTCAAARTGECVQCRPRKVYALRRHSYQRQQNTQKIDSVYSMTIIIYSCFWSGE